MTEIDEGLKAAYLRDYEDIKQKLGDMIGNLVTISDIQTGRNTHPLVDDVVHDPFNYFLAIELQRIEGSIRHLQSNVHNQIVTLESFVELMGIGH